MATVIASKRKQNGGVAKQETLAKELTRLFNNRNGAEFPLEVRFSPEASINRDDESQGHQWFCTFPYLDEVDEKGIDNFWLDDRDGEIPSLIAEELRERIVAVQDLLQKLEGRKATVKGGGQ